MKKLLFVAVLHSIMLCACSQPASPSRAGIQHLNKIKVGDESFQVTGGYIEMGTKAAAADDSISIHFVRRSNYNPETVYKIVTDQAEKLPATVAASLNAAISRTNYLRIMPETMSPHGPTNRVNIEIAIKGNFATIEVGYFRQTELGVLLTFIQTNYFPESAQLFNRLGAISQSN